MFTVLDRISWPGHPDKPNEDICGVSGDWAWVIDTSIFPGTSPVMHEKSDATWLARWGLRQAVRLRRGQEGCGNGWCLLPARGGTVLVATGTAPDAGSTLSLMTLTLMALVLVTPGFQRAAG